MSFSDSKKDSFEVTRVEQFGGNSYFYLIFLKVCFANTGSGKWNLQPFSQPLTLTRGRGILIIELWGCGSNFKLHKVRVLAWFLYVYIYISMTFGFFPFYTYSRSLDLFRSWERLSHLHKLQHSNQVKTL